MRSFILCGILRVVWFTAWFTLAVSAAFLGRPITPGWVLVYSGSVLVLVIYDEWDRRRR